MNKNYKLYLFLIVLFLTIIFTGNTNANIDFNDYNINITLNETEAYKIGEKIRFNETGGRDEFLISWNEGEEFLSLGIGHFIWYPGTDDVKVFQESFIYFLEFLNENNYELPKFLKNNPPAFWNNRVEFINSKNTTLRNDLYDFIISTIPYQLQFLIQRLKNSFPEILKTIEEEEVRNRVYNNYLSLTAVENGFYPLIDYINFKGEGTSVNEQYKGEGWGLLQVLIAMDAENENPLKAFAEAAILVLDRRIKNSPPERGEQRWRAGWKRRVSTYYK